MADHRREAKFVTEGFCCWNDGKRKFDKHQQSGSHKDAVASLNRHGAGKVDEMLDRNLRQNKLDAHDMIVFVINAIKHLSRQGLPLRGTYDKDSEVCEPDSNLWQLLCSYSKISDSLNGLMKRNITYTSSGVQNELLDIMLKSVQDEVVSKIRQAPFYTLMLDETPDISSKEQLVICFR